MSVKEGGRKGGKGERERERERERGREREREREREKEREGGGVFCCLSALADSWRYSFTLAVDTQIV